MTAKNFDEDSYVQVISPNGDYRFGFVLETAEQGYHLVICLHEEAESKLAYESATGRWNGQPDGAQYGLSAQESRVLQLLGEEMDTGEIARELKLAPGTVRSYLRTLRIKVRADNRTQLVMVAKAMVQPLEDEE